MVLPVHPGGSLSSAISLPLQIGQGNSYAGGLRVFNRENRAQLGGLVVVFENQQGLDGRVCRHSRSHDSTRVPTRGCAFARSWTLTRKDWSVSKRGRPSPGLSLALGRTQAFPGSGHRGRDEDARASYQPGRACGK
jgi:hypothetical protein